MNTLDLALLAVLGAAAGFVLTRDAALTQSLHWKSLGPYLWRQDGQPGLLLQGFFTTIRLTCWASLFALPLGIVVGLARISSSLYLRLMGTTFVEICRNTPPLVLIFVCYYFLADQIAPSGGLQDLARHAPPWIQDGLRIALGPLGQVNAFVSAAATLGLYEGAYVAEIVRGAIQSVPVGQWEAGQAMGFSRLGLLRHIILPQATRPMIPPLAGQMISTIKDSAIVSVISIQELTFQANQLMATTYQTVEIWTCVTLLYFILTFSCSLAAGWLEQRFRQNAAW